MNYEPIKRDLDLISFIMSASEDIPERNMVRSLIEDIRDVRFHKVQTNLEKFTASAVTWKNMSAMEVNIIRAFSGRALQAFYKHEQLTPDSDRAPDTQPQIPSNRPRFLAWCLWLMKSNNDNFGASLS
ncbi:hypothetical protein Tsubulata_037569 [Turnera subulata]|uniref:GINS subunit domain-containing protein n=1 Tax=Turnera subulata TaxID=218843 RepID=A0A9Q0J6D4_9ROSI|nr:hypothetical protein Tsubulata_037569 [Turnera subulata]